MGKRYTFLSTRPALKLSLFSREIYGFFSLVLAPFVIYIYINSANVVHILSQKGAYNIQDVVYSVNYSSIMMHKSDVNRIITLLKNVETYIEWGSGGSTLNYPKFVRKSSYSIEHSPSWCRYIRRKLGENPSLSHVNYFCIAPSSGKQSWNRRISRDGTYLNFQEYVNIVDQLNESYFDFALIDGRARLPIAIKLLSYITPTSMVVLHDANRLQASQTNYSKILQFYDVLDNMSTKSLAVLRRKKEFNNFQGDQRKMQNLLDNYSED